MAPDNATPVIFLLDIDSFFAQAEQIKRPELRGKPVIVGGEVTDRSVVASASYEARACGVRSAMPMAQAVRLCPEATFLRGNYALYAELSAAMYDVCLRHTPQVERVSLDECFLDLTGCERHYRHGRAASAPAWPLEAACRLQQDVLRSTGLRVSVGVATSRVVAKVTSDLAKPAGVLYAAPGYEAALLAPLELGRLPGVGPKTAERLQRYGLRTIADLAAISPELLSHSFGAAGEYLYEAAHGRGGAVVISDESLPKSISRETTFEVDTCDRQEISAMLSYLLQRAGRQLREQGLLAATVSLKLRYSDFETTVRSRTIAQPSDHDDTLYQVLMELLPRTYQRRVAVRLVGVSLSGLSDEGRQLMLFDEPDHDRRSRLYASMDAVRERYGFAALVTSRAIDLLETHARTDDGFQLPVSCLSR